MGEVKMERIEYVDHMFFEATRRCNLECAHCLRGDSEDMDLTQNIVDSILPKIETIGCIGFGGGEPSLVPEIMDMILARAGFHGVDIGNFDITTNGMDIGGDFLAAVARWYAYCSDNEISTLTWSDDVFHDDSWQAGAELLKAFRFARGRGEGGYHALDWRGDHVLKEGRADGTGNILGLKLPKLSPFVLDDNRLMEGHVYVNCEGNVISGCDWSYKSQRLQEHIICRAKDFSLDQVVEFMRLEEVLSDRR